MQCHHFFSSEDVDVINCFIFMLLYRPVIRNLTECQLIPNVAQGFFNVRISIFVLLAISIFLPLLCVFTTLPPPCDVQLRMAQDQIDKDNDRKIGGGQIFQVGCVCVCLENQHLIFWHLPGFYHLASCNTFSYTLVVYIL